MIAERHCDREFLVQFGGYRHEPSEVMIRGHTEHGMGRPENLQSGEGKVRRACFRMTSDDGAGRNVSAGFAFEKPRDWQCEQVDGSAGLLAGRRRYDYWLYRSGDRAGDDPGEFASRDVERGGYAGPVVADIANYGMFEPLDVRPQSRPTVGVSQQSGDRIERDSKGHPKKRSVSLEPGKLAAQRLFAHGADSSPFAAIRSLAGPSIGPLARPVGAS